MRNLLSRGAVTAGLFAALALFAAGCGKTDGTGGEAKDKGDKGNGEPVAEKKGDHSGWWCKEHGVPEEVCSVCSDKAAKGFKDKGDWCEEHGRAESQCFLCSPKRAEKFAAQYRAKYGKEPPPIDPENVKGGKKEGDGKK